MNKELSIVVLVFSVLVGNFIGNFVYHNYISSKYETAGE